MGIINNLLKILHPVTGEDLKPTIADTWRDGSVMTDDKCGGLYNQDSYTDSDTYGKYFKWNAAGAWPVSRLTTVNQVNLQKLINDFGSKSATISLDKTVAIVSNMTIPDNIKIDFIPGSTFNISAGVTLDIQSGFTEGDYQLFSGLGNILIKSPYLNVKWFGAKGLAKVVGNGVANAGSNVITSATAGFTPNLVGQKIMVRGGAGSKPLVTTITAVQSSTQVTVLNAATATVNNVEITYGGVDETAFFQKTVDTCILNGGIRIVVPSGRYWIEDAVYVNPLKQIPVSIFGASDNSYIGGYGDQSTGTTILRSTPGDIFRVNLDAAGNSVMDPSQQYMGWAISGISFSGKSDLPGINAIKTFRTRGAYRNLFAARIDYLLKQENTDASGNLNYCDMDKYENIRISSSLYSGMLLSRADASVIDGFYFEGQMASCKYGLEIENSTTVVASGLLNWGGAGMAATIAGGAFVRLDACFAIQLNGIHIEACAFEAGLYFGNCGAISVNSLHTHIGSGDMFRIHTVRGLAINDWFSFEAKRAGTYDINVLSAYDSNADIIHRNAELYDYSQPAPTVPRQITINNPQNLGLVKSEIRVESSSDLNSHYGFKFIRTLPGAANLPANTTYMNGLQVMSNFDTNFQMQLLTDGFKWYKRYKQAGVWGQPFTMIDSQSLNAVTSVTDGPAVTLNAELGYHFLYRWTLGADRTVPLLYNPSNGQKIAFRIKQDGNGSRLLTWNSVFRFPGAVAPTLSTSPNAVDYLEFIYHSTEDKWDLIRFFRGDDSIRPLRNLTNTATAAPNKAGLNSLYGTSKAGSVISYPSITGGGLSYRKADDTNTSEWYSSPITILA